MMPANPSLLPGQYLGQTTEFQARKEASRGDAEEEKRGETAENCCAQRERSSATEALRVLPGPTDGVRTASRPLSA